ASLPGGDRDLGIRSERSSTYEPPQGCARKFLSRAGNEVNTREQYSAPACVLTGRKSERARDDPASIWSAVCVALVVSNDVASDGVAAAQLAGLRYASDEQPGIRRRRKGRGFAYVDRDGIPVRDEGELRRIRRLAIPPAWTDVWISPSPLGQ